MLRSLIAYPCIPNATTDTIALPNEEAASLYTTNTATYNEICLSVLSEEILVDYASVLHYKEEDQAEIMKSIIETNESLTASDERAKAESKSLSFHSWSTILHSSSRPTISINNNDTGSIIHRLSRENSITELNSFLANGDSSSIINATNDKGNTGLHIACNFGYTEIASLLIAHGADTSIKNKYGRTPYRCAVFNERFGILQLFSTHILKEASIKKASTTWTKLVHIIFEYIDSDFKLFSFLYC